MLDWLPAQSSSFAGDIDGIFAVIYYVTLAWFILLHLLLFYSLIAFRKKKGVAASYLTGETMRQALWLLIPCFIVLVLDLWIDHRGAQVWALVKEETPAADLKVKVMASQFNWEFQYAGRDGVLDTPDDFNAENSLHVPVGKVVVLSLESYDVLHSFFVPEFRLKQDAVPGRTIPVWFKATEPGKYEIGCAELCGFGHTTMRGLLTVHTPEEWEAWTDKRWPRPDESAGRQVEGKSEPMKGKS